VEKRIVIFAAALATLAAAGEAPAEIGAGRSGLVEYISAIDGSAQKYGLYVPSSYSATRPEGFALVIHGGGYGYVADADFYKPWVDPYNCLFLNYDGRHRLQYDGVGEQDLFQVLDELQSQYNIDPNRVYFEGHSMGSTGSMRISFRHPDRFAAVAGGAGFLDYEEWYERWYAGGTMGVYGTQFSGPDFRRPLLEQSSVVDLAENAAHLPCYFTAGTYDTVNRPWGAHNLDARLAELGYQHTFEEYPTGHDAGYYYFGVLDYFFSNDFTRDPYVPDVVYKTNQLKYNEAYWTRIDRLQQHLEWAEIRTGMTAAGNRIDVSVSNVTQYTLDLSTQLLSANGLDPARPVTVYTNGALSYSGAAGTVTLYADVSGGSVAGWSTTNLFASGLVKNHGVEGPIGHAFTSSFTLLYGSGSEQEAQLFARDWNNPQQMAGNITPLSIAAFNDSMAARDNLILFGTTDSNELLRRITFDLDLPFNLPIKVTGQFIDVAGRLYSTEEYGIFMIYPNPLNPQRYVVVSDGTLFGSALTYEFEALPWAYADYVIFDRDAVFDPATMSNVQGYGFAPSVFAEAGYFDNNWQIVPEPVTLALLAAGLCGLAALRRR